MFTGIVETTAEVLRCGRGRLTLTRPQSFDDIKKGSSIAVSGVCLSIVALDKNSMSFDVIPTSLRKSTLGSLCKNDVVNLERALPISGRFEGHVVLGHCEGVGAVVSVTKRGSDVLVSIRYPTDLKKFIVRHGSIAVDGVSLTVASVDRRLFTIALIPHTLKATTLGKLGKGSVVNLETDILGKYMR